MNKKREAQHFVFMDFKEIYIYFSKKYELVFDEQEEGGGEAKHRD